MKITDVRTMWLLGPRPHSVGGKESEINKVIVRIDTDEGIYGLGEAEDFMGVRDGLNYFKAWLIGRSPFEVRPFFSEMLCGTLPSRRQTRQYQPAQFKDTYRPVLESSPTANATGPVIWALSALDMALCDLVGKALKTPVYNLLGGRFRDRVRIYLDRSSPPDVENIDSWKRMGADSLEGGFTHLKFDVDFTAPDFTEDHWNRSLSSQQIRHIVERIGAVRETIGWDVELCVDCHTQYTATDAIRLAQELAPLKLAWMEDPTPHTNPDACADVRQKSAIPICVGEMFTAEQYRLFIDRGACDIIHPDVLFCGGLHEARRIADYAELHYLPMAMHSNGGSLAVIAAAHVAAASRNFLGLEYHFIEADWIGSYVRREGLPLFRDGHLPLSDAPGLGVELDRAVCEESLAPGETFVG